MISSGATFARFGSSQFGFNLAAVPKDQASAAEIAGDKVRWLFGSTRCSERHVEDGRRFLLKCPIDKKHTGHEHTLKAQDCAEPAGAVCDPQGDPVRDRAHGIGIPQDEEQYGCDTDRNRRALPAIVRECGRQVHDRTGAGTSFTSSL